MHAPFAVRPAFVPIVSATATQKLLFPVRRIYCVGQNYESHAREMGACANKSDPFFFTKPADTIVTVHTPEEFALQQALAAATTTTASAATRPPLANTVEAFPTSASTSLSVRYPSMTESYHYEVELVVAIGPRGYFTSAPADGSPADEVGYTNVPFEDAGDLIFAYGIGLDMTRRDLQKIAKTNGKPWDLAKGAEDSAVVSPLVLARDLRESHAKLFSAQFESPAGDGRGWGGHVLADGEDASPAASKDVMYNVKKGGIYLNVNGSERQRGNMSCMLNTPQQLITSLSKFVTLRPGDLLYTGTPGGVGAVRRGDIIQAGIEGIGELQVTVE